MSARILPADENFSNTSAGFNIWVPVDTPNGLLEFESVEYFESHSDGVVHLSVDVNYGSRKGATSNPAAPPAEIGIQLPVMGASVVRCDDGAVCQITTKDGYWPPNTLLIANKDSAGDPLTHVDIDLGGVEGLGFTVTNSRVQVRLPTAYPDVPEARIPPAPKSPAVDDVGVVYKIPDANKFTWGSPTPRISALWDSKNSSVDALAYWEYWHENAPAPFIGIRDDVLDKQSRATFNAGVWLGIAGASLVAALQAVLAGITLRRS
ncbi:hypothetical protein [Nocardia concava]|uniref:hypothetical protein n=1 Tax=Nocardia concava TaxID=257281 RepID=UPI0012FA934E|nr:hypothetical protein [Nocardia concava]